MLYLTHKTVRYFSLINNMSRFDTSADTENGSLSQMITGILNLVINSSFKSCCSLSSLFLIHFQFLIGILSQDTLQKVLLYHQKKLMVCETGFYRCFIYNRDQTIEKFTCLIVLRRWYTDRPFSNEN